jgi:hypothetical protein
VPRKYSAVPPPPLGQPGEDLAVVHERQRGLRRRARLIGQDGPEGLRGGAPVPGEQVNAALFETALCLAGRRRQSGPQVGERLQGGLGVRGVEVDARLGLPRFDGTGASRRREAARGLDDLGGDGHVARHERADVLHLLELAHVGVETLRFGEPAERLGRGGEPGEAAQHERFLLGRGIVGGQGPQRRGTAHRRQEPRRRGEQDVEVAPRARPEHEAGRMRLRQHTHAAIRGELHGARHRLRRIVAEQAVDGHREDGTVGVRVGSARHAVVERREVERRPIRAEGREAFGRRPRRHDAGLPVGRLANGVPDLHQHDLCGFAGQKARRREERAIGGDRRVREALARQDLLGDRIVAVLLSSTLERSRRAMR